MSTSSTAKSTERNSLSALEGRLRAPLEKAQAQAEKRLKKVSKLIVQRPAASLAVAFVVGFGLARLLQKIS